MLQVLAQFHREVVLPDAQRISDNAVAALRNEMYTQFDGVYVRFNRLEPEYQALRSGLSRIDERLSRVESEVQSLSARAGRVESELQSVKSSLATLEGLLVEIDKKTDRLATEADVLEIKQQVETLNDRIAALETRH
jgi:chromosome segregation ATPase